MQKGQQGMEKGVENVQKCQGEAAKILQTLPDTERPNLKPLYNALGLRFGKKYSNDYTRLQIKARLQKTRESLQEYASEGERLINLAFSDHPATVQEVISLQYFVDGLKDEEIQKAVRMADVQDLKSVLVRVYSLKVEAANEATCRDSHYIRGTKVTTDAPCESPWRKEIEKMREKIQDLMAQRQNLRRRRITCWGCGGAGHLRSSCPRIITEDHDIKFWACGEPGISADENGEVRSKTPCSEIVKNLSISLRVEKKFGVIDPLVRQFTTPSTLQLDPWSDDNVRKEQHIDPEIKPIIEFKESSDEKPSWQNIDPFHPTTKRDWALWESLHLRNGVLYRKWESDGGKTFSDVEKCCRICDPCAARKVPRKRTRGILQLYNVGAAFERIAPCSEIVKNLSISLRVEKKFGVIDPLVRQFTTPSTLQLDPWSDDNVRKEQHIDPEIKPIIEFKESSDEKPSWQNIDPFHPTTKRDWALWESLHLRNGVLYRKWESGLFGNLSI
ncbi:uncharacterized protein TNCV_1555031 [Trichonephila clavipes]|nr:uncharacterized protein TNCV_1555031 [Trichonephila clavipes]